MSSMNNSARNLPGNAVRYLGKLVLTLFLSICLFIPTPAFALDYNSEAKNYLTSVQNDLSSIKTIVQKLPNTSLDNGQKTLDEVQAKLDTIESDSKQKTLLFKNFSNNYQVSYQDKLTSISKLYDLQKQYNRSIPTLSKGAKEMLDRLEDCEKQRNQGGEIGDIRVFSCSLNASMDVAGRFPQLQFGAILQEVNNFREISNQLSIPLYFVNQSIQQYEQEGRDLSKVIVLTDKVSILANNLEKRINLAKQKVNNVKEYAEVLRSFSDPDILGEIKDLDQYIGELTQNLPL